MNPYEVLGVTPAAPIEQIETAYRLRMREWHPDLHQAEGPEAVARAEAHSRQLNAAMTRIRQEHRDGGPGAWRAYDAPRAEPGAGARTAEDRGWWDTDYRRWYGYGTQSPFTGAGGPGAGGPGANDTGGSAARDWAPPDPNRDWFGVGSPTDEVPCPYCGQGFAELDAFNIHLVADHQFRRAIYRPRRSRAAAVVDTIGAVRFIPLWLAAPAAVMVMFLAPFWAWTIGWSVVALILWAQTTSRFKRNRYTH
jgi:curved DNA-binding protein CbpA